MAWSTWGPNNKRRSRQCSEGVTEAARGEKSTQIRPDITSEKHTCKWAMRKQNRTARAPLCNALTPAALQHKLCYGISSREELQKKKKNSVHQHHHSFLPISISCGLPTAASIQTCPHSQSRYCLFSGGKVLTHSTKASLSCCVGTVAQRRGATRCQVDRHQAISYLNSIVPELT